jgi:hypothetical protein
MNGTASNYINGEILQGTLISTAGYGIKSNTGIIGSNLRFETGIRDNRDNAIISQSLSSVTTNRVLTIGNGTYINVVIDNPRLIIGSTTDSGEKLQVTGTAKFGGNIGGGNQRVANFRNSGGNAFIELQSSGSGAVALWTASGNEFGIYQNSTAGTIGTSAFYINSSGNIGVNTFSINASAKLQVDSTTQGFLPPRMTTTQKNAIATPAAGLVVYDTTLNKLCVYTTAWETITSL